MRARAMALLLCALVPAVAGCGSDKKPSGTGDLEVTEQNVEAPSFATRRAMPLCRWPAWPHYKSGPVTAAASFACAP